MSLKNKRLVIVGIDPGATVGYAVLDIEGRLVDIKSIRQISLSELILEIMRHGKVVVVASDVNPAGKLTRDLARKMGARLVQPETSLRIKEKKKLIVNLDYDNLHERDALAAAVYAYKRLRALLTKVDKSFLGKSSQKTWKENLGKEIRKEEIEKIKALVLTKAGMSISRAAESISD